MATPMVTCANCTAVVPAAEADYCANGMLCRQCAMNADIGGNLGVAVTGPEVIALAERGFARSQAIKHVVIGTLALLAAVPAAGFVAWMISEGAISSRMVMLAVLLIGTGVTELGRGLSGLARLPPAPARSDGLPQARLLQK